MDQRPITRNTHTEQITQSCLKVLDRFRFPDVVIRARDHARQLTSPRYSAAVIDEAQDLTLTGLQLVRALVNAPDGEDKPDGLLLVGDGAQRIYAGGFTLRQAGVEVRGRTSVLRVNYRNTDEIVAAAMAVAGEAPVDDLGEAYKRGEERASAHRRGPRPLLVRAQNFDDQVHAIAGSIGNFTSKDGTGAGDIAVLVPTNRMVDQVMDLLKAAGVSNQDLEKYDGKPNERVKVGTYHRGKGLEFKVVFLPGLSKGSFPRAAQPPLPEHEAEEDRQLAVSRLFVAMTRARDALVLLYSGELSEVLTSYETSFDRRST
ncbi:MAG: 3'-5' exonuclease [Acidimicrobiales bacterium]